MSDESVKKHKESMGFVRQLAMGKIDEHLLFPYPQGDLDENDMVQTILEHLDVYANKNIKSEDIEARGELGSKLLQELADMGLFGLIIPEQYGGAGLSQSAYAKIFEKLGSIDASIAVTIGAHTSIGLKGLLLAGNETQKQRYLPKLANGDMFAAFALTEPGSGSDAYSIQSRADKQVDGSYILNGSKIWITNGGFADFFTVFAKTKITQDGEVKDKISAFIVTRDMEGVSTGLEEKKLGIKASSTVEVFFKDVHIPKENLLGTEGKGFKLAMEILNSGRLGLASGCIGGARTLMRLSADHANTRKQFDRSIGSFGMIKEKLGIMASQVYALDAATYLTCRLLDQGMEDYSIESAICKVAGSEILWDIANEATQIAGGSSYMQEYPYEQMLRDSRINMIFEGTNEILRCFIALSCIKLPGEHLKLIQKSLLNSPIKSLGLLYGFVSQKVSRNVYGDDISLAAPQLKKYTANVESYVVTLANTVERLLQKHGNKVIYMQLAQKRLADVCIDLYLMVACIAKCSFDITKSSEQDNAGLDLDIKKCKVFCQMASKRIENNLLYMENNYDEYIKAIANESFDLEVHTK